MRLDADHVAEQQLEGRELCVGGEGPVQRDARRTVWLEGRRVAELPVVARGSAGVATLAVWLHDIGQADGKYDIDHAVLSEKEVKEFLSKNQAPNDLIKRVAHCVRAHRCKDVQPKTIEAKIIAAADSVSHMTDINYLVALKDGFSRKEVLAKLVRDYRDKNYLPKELIDEVNKLYQGWRGLLKVFPENVR